MARHWKLMLTLTVLMVIAVVGRLAPYLRGYFVTTDTAEPFVLEFGRGSGRDGLDTVKVLEDGTVLLHRWKAVETKPRHYRLRLEHARLSLAEPAVLMVKDAVDRNGLAKLQAEYSDPNIADGVQWVLRVVGRATYFNNIFPDRVRRFADELDEILNANGLAEVEWREVAYPDPRAHERELWDSIR